MTTLAEMRRARRRDATATKQVQEAHREALQCYAHDNERCLCDCGCSRKEHALGRDLISARGHLIRNGECGTCSCTRFAPVDTFSCEWCGNDVRPGEDNDHCNDCAILTVT